MRLAPMLGILALPAFAPAAEPPKSGRLSPTESRISAAVDAGRAASLTLLERAVDVNSGTMNFEGVHKVGAIFRQELDELGFSTRWVEGEAFHRAGHLVAEHPGPGPKILLIGHLDTVFPRDSGFARFERLDETHARGPGVIDMKGGDVVALGALRALRAAGLLDRVHATVVMSGDEEDAGHPIALARAALLSAAEGAAAALGFEDGAGRPGEAVVARRGSSAWQIRVSATPAHSSQIFRKDVGAGAILEAARVLDRFYESLAGERDLTFSPGVILGGTEVRFDDRQSRGDASGKDNVVARDAVVQGDLRTISPEQLESAKARMREIADGHLPGASTVLTFEDGYPPMAPREGHLQLLALYDRVSRDLGLGPVVATDPMSAGAADVAFVAERVPMILDGIGLCGTDDHTDRETADLSELGPQTKRAALLIWRLSTGSAD